MSKSIIESKSKYKSLKFNKLFGYCNINGVELNKDSFKKDLGLLNSNNEYNILAQLLSDDSHFSIKVALVNGISKQDPVYLVSDFGNNCLLYSIEDLLRYINILNMKIVDETDRIMERKETPIFDGNIAKEVVLNAILHNSWEEGKEPIITVFRDRMEVVSNGTISRCQTLAGFFAGKSVPVNQKLYELCAKLHIINQVGRGVPSICARYGYEVFDFENNKITVTIPFEKFNKRERENIYKSKPNKIISYSELDTKKRNMLLEISYNPHITKSQLAQKLNVSSSTVDNYLSELKKEGYLARVGANKNGGWEILK